MTSSDFDNHLQHASEVVSTWPKWKQTLLGGQVVQPQPKWRVRIINKSVCLEFFRANGIYQGFTVANAGSARWMQKMLLLAMRDLAKENEYQAKDKP